MLSKLFYGQFSFQETFWKFGILGILCCTLFAKIFKVLVAGAIKGVPIIYYYTHYFSPLKMDGYIIFVTCGYVLLVAMLCIYSIILFCGIWRSSAEYNKSLWLRYIARLIIAIVIYVSVKAIL